MSNKFDRQLIDRISLRLVEFRAAIHAEIDDMVAEEVSGRLVAKALEEVKQRIEGGLKATSTPPAIQAELPMDTPPAHPSSQGGH